MREQGGERLLKLLIGIFIKDKDNVDDPLVRKAYGSLCSIYGILLNLLLFAGKYAAGVVSGSIAVTADAFNNLSDAGSSGVSLLGFRLSGKKPDTDHPFGHGRIEYISGLVIAALILIMGAELLISSAEKVMHPQPAEFSWLTVGILLASVLVKLYMFFYNRSVGRRISSSAMVAAAADSLSDSVSTLVVLVSTLLLHFAGVNIDAYAGLMVACFILYTAGSVAKDTISPLLGQAPDPELVNAIAEIAQSDPHILGIHDLIIHDYGPGRRMVSLHAEVDGKGDFFELHDIIDQTESRLKAELGCDAVIHMDPVVTDDEAVSRKREMLRDIIRDFDPELCFHDFRMIEGPSHTNLVFEVAVPPGYKLSKSELKRRLTEEIESRLPDHYCVMTVEDAYVTLKENSNENRNTSG